MNEEQGAREKTFEEKTKEEILGAFLLVNDYRILTNEELEEIKKEKAKKENKQSQWKDAIRFWIKEMNIEE